MKKIMIFRSNHTKNDEIQLHNMTEKEAFDCALLLDVQRMKLENQSYILRCNKISEQQEKSLAESHGNVEIISPTKEEQTARILAIIAQSAYAIEVNINKLFKTCIVTVTFNIDAIRDLSNNGVNVSLFSTSSEVEKIIFEDFKFKPRDGGSGTVLNGNEFRILFDLDVNNAAELSKAKNDLKSAIENVLDDMLKPTVTQNAPKSQLS